MDFDYGRGRDQPFRPSSSGTPPSRSSPSRPPPAGTTPSGTPPSRTPPSRPKLTGTPPSRPTLTGTPPSRPKLTGTPLSRTPPSQSTSFNNHKSKTVNQANVVNVTHQTIYQGAHTPATTKDIGASRFVGDPVDTYTERQELSSALEKKLAEPYSSAAYAHAVTVTGLAGTGKTQLVLRYIQMHEKDYKTILWLDARSQQSVRSSFEWCCSKLGLSYRQSSISNEPKDAPGVKETLEWLRGRPLNHKWLVIVDNADDLSWDVRSIIPTGAMGTVIITSTNDRASGLLGRAGSDMVVRVDKMQTHEAVALLLKTIRVDSQTLKNSLAERAGQVVDCLDRLPFAIDLAGAWIKAKMPNGQATKDAIKLYLQHFQLQRDRLLRDESFAQSSSYRKTVWTAWKTTLTALQKIDTDEGSPSFRLLVFLSTLHSANIQTELFRLASLGSPSTERQLDAKLPSWLRKLLSTTDGQTWNDFYFNDSIEPLLRYGLVRPVTRRDGGGFGGWTMHSLVQWRARGEMSPDEYFRWYSLFVTAVCSQNTEEADKTRFRRHMTVHLPKDVSIVEEHSGVGSLAESWICMTVAKTWQDEARWKESEALYYAAFRKRSKALGPKHPDTLLSMSNLAASYWSQGRCSEAETYYKMVLETREKDLGKEHPDTLTSINNLASVYEKQSRWQEAENLQQRALAVMSRTMGEDHISTLSTIRNLASTYSAQGKWSKAEEYEKKALKGFQKRRGPDDSSTLTTQANLANTYRNQKRLDEAEALDRTVLEKRKKVLGVDHHDTLISMGSLAATLRQKGRLGEAESLEAQVVKATETWVLENRLDVISSIENVAKKYRTQQQWADAERLEQQAIEIRKGVLGEQHPDTLSSMVNLATIYWKQGRWKDAASVEEDVVAKRKEVLGNKHAETVWSMSELASTYGKLLRWEDSKRLRLQVMEITKEILGERHSETVASMAKLATAYKMLLQWNDAKNLEEKILKIRTTDCGEEHADTLTAMDRLAVTYTHLDQWNQADQLDERRKKILQRIGNKKG